MTLSILHYDTKYNKRGKKNHDYEKILTIFSMLAIECVCVCMYTCNQYLGLHLQKKCLINIFILSFQAKDTIINMLQAKRLSLQPHPEKWLPK